MKITTTIGSLVAIVFLLNMPGGVSAESTSADQLLALAKSAAPIEVRAMQKQVMRLLEEIGVRKEVREGFDEMHFWDVKKSRDAVWSESEDHAIVVSGESVTLGTAGYPSSSRRVT